MLQVLFCESELGLKSMGFIGTIISIIKILVPIILIVVGTISLVKCIINNKEETKKEILKLVKKCVLAIAIFLLPSVVMFLINLVGENTGGAKCMECLLSKAGACMKEAEKIKLGITDTLCSIYDWKEEECKRPCEYVSGYCQKID